MRRFQLSHTRFVIIFPALLFGTCNALNIRQAGQVVLREGRAWTIWPCPPTCLPDLCLFIVVFALLAHRWTIKPLAVVLTIAERGSDVFHRQVQRRHRQLHGVEHRPHRRRRKSGNCCRCSMVPYVVFLMVLPVLIILSIDITFRPSGRYLLDFAQAHGDLPARRHCVPVLELQGHTSGPATCRTSTSSIRWCPSTSSRVPSTCLPRSLKPYLVAAARRIPRYPDASRLRATWSSCSRSESRRAERTSASMDTTGGTPIRSCKRPRAFIS